MRLIFCFMLAILFLPATAVIIVPQNCKIYCYGPLLDTVQRAGIFVDSKDFVDRPLLYDLDTTLKAFNSLDNKSDMAQLKRFVSYNFDEPGSELRKCRFNDWEPDPASFNRIQDATYRFWAGRLHAKWMKLCRKVRDAVKFNPDRFSIIYVPHQFVAPGGRFRELYGWDSYWIIKGLLASEMYTTAQNMAWNLAELVEQFGFVPNGGRIYYANRTHPPLFAGCVYDIYKATNNLTFVRAMLPILEKERNFWNSERRVNVRLPSGDQYTLYQYRVKAHGPRPEAYIEDLFTSSSATTDEQKKQLYSEIQSATESGWDFSSRWLSHNESDVSNYTLRSIRTTRLVPVDLNAFICMYDYILWQLFNAVGNVTGSYAHESSYRYLRFAIYNVFWNNEHGVWYDYDLETREQNKEFYGSNLTPLYTKCAHESGDVYSRVVDYLKTSGAINFPTGFPTSFIFSGQQWDAPNGWANIVHMLIESLSWSDDPKVQEVAFRIADKWIKNNYFVYVRSFGKMFEKYNIELQRGTGGSGGEYPGQTGFGWTNAVTLILLMKYGDRLQAITVPRRSERFFPSSSEPLTFSPPSADDPRPDAPPMVIYRSTVDIVFGIDPAIYAFGDTTKDGISLSSFFINITTEIWRSFPNGVRLHVVEVSNSTRTLIDFEEGSSLTKVIAAFRELDKRRSPSPTLASNPNIIGILPHYVNETILGNRSSTEGRVNVASVFFTVVPPPGRLFHVEADDGQHWLTVSDAVITGAFDYGTDVVFVLSNFSSYSGKKPLNLNNVVRLEISNVTSDNTTYSEENAYNFTRWVANLDDTAYVTTELVKSLRQVFALRYPEDPGITTSSKKFSWKAVLGTVVVGALFYIWWREQNGNGPLMD